MKMLAWVFLLAGGLLAIIGVLGRVSSSFVGEVIVLGHSIPVSDGWVGSFGVFLVIVGSALLWRNARSEHERARSRHVQG